MVRHEVIPQVAGHDPKPITLELGSQRVAIRGVVVDNSAGTVPVNVYSGRSRNGVPFVIPPGRSRGIALADSSAVHITFEGRATADGSVFISVHSEPQLGFGTETMGLQPGSSVSIEGPVDVSGSTINTNVALGSDYPTGAVTFGRADRFAISSTPHNVTVLQPIALASRIYVAGFATTGLSSQRIEWRLDIVNADEARYLTAVGDVAWFFTKPLFFGIANATAVPFTLTSTFLGVPQNPDYVQVNVFTMIQGYWLPPIATLKKTELAVA